MLLSDECKIVVKSILEDLNHTDLDIHAKIEYCNFLLVEIFTEYKKYIFPEFVKQLVYENYLENDAKEKQQNPYEMNWTCPKDYIQKTLAIKQPEQRSPEWFAFRSERLTASDIATALGENAYARPTELILKKCGISKPFTMNPACQHGVKYEPISCMVYEYYNNTKVYEFGCISHKYYNFLGASPDGICSDGTMLEIKNPLSRKINGIPPKYYWIQMQIQMEVFNLQQCDYLECKMTEYFDYDEYVNDDSVGNERKGVLVEFCTSENYNEPKYKYCPIECHDKLAWVKDEEETFKSLPNSMYDLRVIWWKMDTYACVRIYRDTEWFSENLPKLASFWDSIVNYRKNEKFKTLIKKKKKKKSVCKLLPDDNEDNTPDQPVCLLLP